MKTLILVRHGKSSWEYSVNDIDRPLQERGINDALLVSSSFKSQNLKIDAVYSSPANRALHTSMIFLRELNFNLDSFQATKWLYDFSGDYVLQFIKELDNDLDTVMIFGHNHAFTHIANSLGNTYIDNVPTTGLVELEFTTDDWTMVTKGITKQTIFPKHLRG
ncbi:SixA phosphatase family protein [Kriegella aquimaris]|uniref:Phosphohistidine phosphatase n=1 Tax=Kriegella aquimaris TaxID=192904 RepID=A0A1G9Y0R6_9FLAO|nr:histidine phosphatase family protein [Kriegella aquimaris]SDN02662.1 phosphohistidine phosphatase [Kriegella aquimaris]